MKYFGWQIGLTYNSRHPKGLDYNYLKNLVDEMHDHNMNLLSIMMSSYGYFDPMHDGYAWPIQNPKLLSYKDKTATNAHSPTEFLSKIIPYAQKQGIDIEFIMNWGIWNHEKIKYMYPISEVQKSKHGKEAGWLHCPDGSDAWQLGLDEMEDLLTYYDHPNVKRYVFERLSYNSKQYCYCDATLKKFHEFQNSSESQSIKSNFTDWKSANIMNYIRLFVKRIKEIRPDIHVGLHSLGKLGWGHQPAKFRDVGIDFVEPHTIQFKTSKRELYRYYTHLNPNPLILHIDGRNNPLHNYPIWQKTPKILNRLFRWIETYPGTNIEGMLFFNEPNIPKCNKETIYENISKFMS